MRKLSVIALLAVAAAFCAVAVNPASASQRPTRCGMDRQWDPQSQRCVGHKPLGPCQPGQFGRLCNPKPQPDYRCRGVRYDPNCDKKPGGGDTRPRRCPPGEVMYLGTCTPRCAAGIVNNCNRR